MKTTRSRTELKKQLKTICLDMQQKQATMIKAAIAQVQESANAEKGTMEDRFESFREQCQIDRDMYSKQLQEIMAGMLVLQKMEANREIDAVMLGSVVMTETQNFFVAISIGELKIKGKTYFAISTSTPLYKAMAGKKPGDTFLFREKMHRIVDVY